ncbi:transmembrane protein 53 isoform X1 [Callorhinchus milii]|uniref:transmembrane protein 53 isoform X1 n=1 Tax=Callorhinchus milii TaxID=7868 RepID=UPI001C3F8754|nr:transmembrane protein 53 isoform X1 [Callorhinchus milii]
MAVLRKLLCVAAPLCAGGRAGITNPLLSSTIKSIYLPQARSALFPVPRRSCSSVPQAPQIQIHRLQGASSDFEDDPVVILLGWAGCREKHLAKYSHIYKKKGCIVISYTAPWEDIFLISLCTRSLHGTAKKLLDLLFDIGIEEHPIVFHVFSNGGCMLYRYIIELQYDRGATRYRKLNVVGTIFDSGPGDKNFQGGIRALHSILRPSNNPFIKIFATVTFVFVALIRFMLYPASKFWSLSLYDSLKQDPSRWPQLYLYSKSDKVISYKDIENMIRARKQLRVRVESVDFGTSQHVNHFREFPEKYSIRVLSFLKQCIGQSTGTGRSGKKHLPM